MSWNCDEKFTARKTEAFSHESRVSKDTSLFKFGKAGSVMRNSSAGLGDVTPLSSIRRASRKIESPHHYAEDKPFINSFDERDARELNRVNTPPSDPTIPRNRGKRTTSKSCVPDNTLLQIAQERQRGMNSFGRVTNYPVDPYSSCAIDQKSSNQSKSSRSQDNKLSSLESTSTKYNTQSSGYQSSSLRFKKHNNGLKSYPLCKDFIVL